MNMNIDRNSQRYSICVHEAGHALMCMFRGVAVKEVGVHEEAPVENRLGYCHRYGADLQADLDIVLAGPVIQAAFLEVPIREFIRTEDGCGGDFDSAWNKIYVSKRHILEKHGSKKLLKYSDNDLLDDRMPPKLSKKDREFLEFYRELLSSEWERTQEALFDRLVYLEEYVNLNTDLVFTSAHAIAERLYVEGKLSGGEVARILIDLWEDKVVNEAVVCGP